MVYGTSTTGIVYGTIHHIFVSSRVICVSTWKGALPRRETKIIEHEWERDVMRVVSETAHGVLQHGSSARLASFFFLAKSQSSRVWFFFSFTIIHDDDDGMADSTSGSVLKNNRLSNDDFFLCYHICELICLLDQKVRIWFIF